MGDAIEERGGGGKMGKGGKMREFLMNYIIEMLP
jgi:hypothetical protein